MSAKMHISASVLINPHRAPGSDDQRRLFLYKLLMAF